MIWRFIKRKCRTCLHPERAVLAGHELRYGLSDARAIPADHG